MSESISHQLSQWASSMSSGAPGKLSIQPLQNPEDLQYVCKGPMIDIWNYIMKHVHPSQTVKKVKGNLILNHMNQSLNSISGTDVKEKSNRSDIESQIANKETILNGSLASSIKQLQNNVESSERSCQIEQTAINECRHRVALLKAYNKMMESKFNHLNQENNDMNSIISKITSHQSACKDTLYVSQDPKVTRNSDSKLEKLSSKRIRDSCLDIEKYIRMNLFKENNLDENALSRLKSKLRKRTEDIVTKQSPVESFDVVSSHLTEAVAEMKKLTDEVDILKDAQLFKPENKYISLPPKERLLENSVEALLSKKQYEHVMTFLKCQNANKELEKLDMDINNLQAEFNRLLDTMTGEFDEKAVRVHMLKEMKEIGLNAAINEISRELTELEVKIEANKQSEHELQNKYEQIQNFDRTVKFKQEIIQVLLREFIENHEQLDKSVQEIEKTQKEIKSGTYCTDKLQNWVQKDTNSLINSNLSSLIAVEDINGLKIRRRFLSILHEFGQRKEIMRHIISELRYPSHKDYNMLCHHLYLSQGNFMKLEVFYEHLENLQMRLNPGSLQNIMNAYNVQGLIDEIKKHDEKLVTDLVPLLKRANVNVNKCLDMYCENTQNALDNWWEQPAQKAIKYIIVGDKAFQEWMSLWTLAVIQLKNTQQR